MQTFAGKRWCYSHVSSAHVLAVVNKGQNERKCHSVASRRHSFWTMKNPTMIYWLLIHPEMKHKLLRFLRVDCLTTSPCHFRRDFAFYQDEIHRFSSCFVLALVCFYPRTFLRSVAFHDDKMNWFRYRDEIGSLPRKVAEELMTYKDYDTLVVY